MHGSKENKINEARPHDDPPAAFDGLTSRGCASPIRFLVVDGRSWANGHHPIKPSLSRLLWREVYPTNAVMSNNLLGGGTLPAFDPANSSAGGPPVQPPGRSSQVRRSARFDRPRSSTFRYCLIAVVAGENPAGAISLKTVAELRSRAAVSSPAS